MKKYLMMAAVASMALTGCVNEESENLTQQQTRKISFDTPVMGIQSRAGEIQGNIYPGTESFVVYAKQYTGDFTKWSEGTDFWTEEGLVASKEGDTWETGDDYYWPPTGYTLTFAAYSPSSVTNATYGNDGLTVTDFDASGNVDLMYSGRITNQTSSVGANGVPVEFKHALSSVVFSAIDADPNANYKITALSVNGSFIKTGTFKENLTDNGVAPSSQGWSNQSAAEPMTHTPNLGGGIEVTAEADPLVETPITQNETAWLMIPQTVNENATVTIDYTVTPTKGAPYDVTNKAIFLEDFKTEETTPASITTWAMANRYKYIIKFVGDASGRVKIVFAPSIDGWTEVAGGQATYTIR